MKAVGPSKRMKKKMATSKQKKNLAMAMADYFIERGSIPTPKEFTLCPQRPTLVKLTTIRRIFGSWSTMEKYTKSFCANKLATMAEKKTNALNELKAKATSVEPEGEYEQNI